MAERELLLLVEDDGATRELLALLLEAEGWAVRAEETGEHALATLPGLGHAPAVALCDLNLPGLCGEHLARALHEQAPGVCLIAMSTSAAKPIPGYWAGLLKPFPPSSVRDELERFRRRGSSGAGTGADCADAITEAAPASPDATPVLDPVILQKLQQTMGAAAAQGLYSFALADTGDRLRRMKTAANTGDADLFRREAHSIKGSCGMIGAQRLYHLAHDAELNLPGLTSAQKLERMLAETEALRLMLEVQFPVQQQMP